METQISIRIEGEVELKHSYYDSDDGFLDTGDFTMNCFHGVYNIDDVLFELSNRWCDEIDTFCGENYDDVVINYMTFTVDIVMITV